MLSFAQVALDIFCCFIWLLIVEQFYFLSHLILQYPGETSIVMTSSDLKCERPFNPKTSQEHRED
jgi:hypothetical protein